MGNRKEDSLRFSLFVIHVQPFVQFYFFVYVGVIKGLYIWSTPGGGFAQDAIEAISATVAGIV